MALGFTRAKDVDALVDARLAPQNRANDFAAVAAWPLPMQPSAWAFQPVGRLRN